MNELQDRIRRTLDYQASTTSWSVTAADARTAQRRHGYRLPLAIATAALVLIGLAVAEGRPGREVSPLTPVVTSVVTVPNAVAADISPTVPLYLIDDPAYLASSAAIRSGDAGSRRPSMTKAWHNAATDEYLTLIVTEHLGPGPARGAPDGEMIIVNGHAVRFVATGEFGWAVWLDGTRAIHVGGLRSQVEFLAVVESVRVGSALADATLTPPPGFVFSAATDESVIPAVMWELNVEYPDIDIQVTQFQSAFGPRTESDRVAVAGKAGLRRDVISPGGTVVLRLVEWEAELRVWIVLTSQTMTTEELVVVADSVTRVDRARFLEAVGNVLTVESPARPPKAADAVLTIATDEGVTEVRFEGTCIVIKQAQAGDAAHAQWCDGTIAVQRFPMRVAAGVAPPGVAEIVMRSDTGAVLARSTPDAGGRFAIGAHQSGTLFTLFGIDANGEQVPDTVFPPQSI